MEPGHQVHSIVSFLKRILLLCIGLVCSLMAGAQTISAIEFVGTERTNEDFLYRWLTKTTGDTLQMQQLDEDLKFLQSLSIFSSVIYEIYANKATLSKDVTISFIVDESQAILPIVGIGGIR